MDRRQRKTREAIFSSFINLLSKKTYEHITVGEIIDNADIGRATFYSHFETKDFLLKELCDELFCHIFDVEDNESGHNHIFDCNSKSSGFLHLFQHIANNDNNLLKLLSGSNNELFLRYFKTALLKFAERELPLLKSEKNKTVPEGYLANHIASTFAETVRGWIENGRNETPEKMTEYFYMVL